MSPGFLLPNPDFLILKSVNDSCADTVCSFPEICIVTSQIPVCVVQFSYHEGRDSRLY